MHGPLQSQLGWDPSLAVGHALIDAQHQELFRRVERLVGAMAAGHCAEAGALFGFLRQYAADHFGAEERLMGEVRYPGIVVHKAAHARFVRELGELVAFYEANGASRAVVVKAQTWIDGWLRAHITGVDVAFGRFLRGR